MHPEAEMMELFLKHEHPIVRLRSSRSIILPSVCPAGVFRSDLLKAVLCYRDVLQLVMNAEEFFQISLFQSAEQMMREVQPSLRTFILLQWSCSTPETDLTVLHVPLGGGAQNNRGGKTLRLLSVRETGVLDYLQHTHAAAARTRSTKTTNQ